MLGLVVRVWLKGVGRSRSGDERRATDGGWRRAAPPNSRRSAGTQRHGHRTAEAASWSASKIAREHRRPRGIPRRRLPRAFPTPRARSWHQLVACLLGSWHNNKIIELVGACLHLLLSLLNIPKRCTSTYLTSLGSDSGYWMTDKHSTSLYSGEAMEGTNQRFSSVSDARFPDECPRELSDNRMKHSWRSRKIR